MKTIKQWLKEGLSKDDYKRAKKYKSGKWELEFKSFESSLSKAFIWSCSKEGWEYWVKIQINGGSFKPDPIVEAVCKDLMERSKLGIKKYGKTLDRDDMDATDWAREMFHELLDASLYCKRLIKELEKIK